MILNTSKKSGNVRLPKQEVITRMARGVYVEDPAQFTPDSTGYILDEWQKRGIRKLFIPGGKGRLAVAACHGSGKCSLSSDLFTLPSGEVVQFKDLIGKRFRTLSLDENLNPIITEAYALDNGNKEVWKITTESGREITRTGNHPLYHKPIKFRSANRPLFGENQWQTVSNLQPGDVIGVTTKSESQGTKRLEDWKPKLLGHLIGDGGFRRSITYSQSQGKALEEVKKIVESLGLRLVRREKEFDYGISNQKGQKNLVLDFTRECGLYDLKSEDQHIPQQIWTCPNDQLATFLSRLFSADGWCCSGTQVRKNGTVTCDHEIGFVSKSERLVRDVHLACLRFGIAGRIRRVRKSWTYKGIKKSDFYWTWTIGDAENTLRFLDRIGIYGKEKACEAVRQYAMRDVSAKSPKWRKRDLPAWLKWEKIKTIEYLGIQPTVAITVPATGVYLTDFFEHNTQMSAFILHHFFWNFVPSKTAVTGPCVEENERIPIVGNHPIPVRDLSGRYFPVTSLMEDYSFATRKATAFPNGVKPVFQLKVKSGRSAIRTPNHPFLKIKDGVRTWVMLSDLKVGDAVGLPNQSNWGEILADEIVEITYLGERMTYGIEVPGPENYLTDFVEHNTGKQTKAQVWTYISEIWHRSVFKEDMSWRKTLMSANARPELWFATWLTSKEPKSIEGFHGPLDGENLLWIVEEGKGVADAVYEALQGALSHNNNFLYTSSTCGRAAGFFYDCFHSKQEDWELERIPYTESSRISPEKVERWARTWGRDSPIFKARVLAQFPDEDEKVIVPLSWAERAIEIEDDDEMDEAA